MKRILKLLMILILSATLVGCSNEQTSIKTIAKTFSELEMEQLELSKLDNEYFLMNVKEYIRKDGNKVIYLYSAPVDEYNYKFKENNEKYKFENIYSNKEFPITLSSEEPIVVGDEYNFIRAYIHDRKLEGNPNDSINVFGETKPSIVYKDAFGEGFDYVCYPTSFGINTEIVIPEKTKNNKYQIKIQLPSYTPDTTSPDYILFKTALEKGEVRSIAYTPMAVDRNGNWEYANRVELIDKDSENNIYTLEYTINEEFLSSKSTKYPVKINQSLYLYTSKQADTSAYEKTGDEPGHYLSPYIILGDNTCKGEGMAYIRYETLDDLNVDPDKIVCAKYIFNSVFDLKKEVEVAAYAVTTDWCSINTRWFNRPTFDEKPISKVEMKKTGEYELDVTQLLKEMLHNKGKEDAKYSIRNGFMIRCNTENSNVVIASGDSGLFSPVLEIVYKE